jgi:hypothetical protein
MGAGLNQAPNATSWYHNLHIYKQALVVGILWVFSALVISSHAFAADPVDDISAVQDLSNFDHMETGFPLDGNHSLIDCESCHIGGVFDALPTQCSACHDGVFAVGQSPSHIPTVENCDVCHSSFGFEESAAALMDHSVLGDQNCVACHDGVTATGKTPDHPVTSDLCEGCHNTNAWTPVLGVDHGQALGRCISCHNGDLASGKLTNHMPATDNCDACHSTTSWVPVTFVDHSQVFGSCISCHNHFIAIGKPGNHIASTDDCSACHAVGTSFAPVINVDHDQILGLEPVCENCHNGIVATGKGPLHIPTT